ncbi:MAG: potassium-transporting ATPase subunit KdpC [Phycisphaeraceae bacterium]|nr:potassium-transporting ATPase subunit KdpC [Phycisphaeraceae bacterium]
MKDLMASLRLVILSIVLCCVIYPAAMLMFARLVVPWRAEGSLLTDAQGRVIGSALISQSFSKPQYFQPRPSAVKYDASAAGGSNLSPTHPAITDQAKEIIGRYGLAEGQRIPADLVTASGSGLDPHISPAAARFQLARVAAARGVPASAIEPLIKRNLDSAGLRMFGGEPVVNVLMLNLALDRLPSPPGQ